MAVISLYVCQKTGVCDLSSISLLGAPGCGDFVLPPFLSLLKQSMDL